MTRTHLSGTIAVAAALVAGMGLTQTPVPADAASSQGLEVLGVPAGRLPSSCRLGTDQRATMSSHTVPAPRAANPWRSTDRRAVVQMHGAIFGTPPMPDGPPLSARELSRARDAYADGAVEAYQATYVTDERVTGEPRAELDPVVLAALMERHVVRAVRFANERQASAAASRVSLDTMLASSSRTTPIVFATTVVVVSGDTSTACYQGLRAYLTSLGPPIAAAR